MKISTCTGPVFLECAGCGETRQVPRGAALRTFNAHVNRFKREHTWQCEKRAQFNREYDKAGRVAQKAVARLIRGRA